MSEFHEIHAIVSQLEAKHDISATARSSKEWQLQRYNEGAGNLNEIDGYDCPICKNKGYIAKLTDLGEEVHVFCKCQKIRATLRRAQKSGLGDVLTDCTFSKFIDSEPWQSNIKSKAKAFCEDDSARWFFIGGQTGAGKSHLCTAIAAHYIKSGKDVRYMMWVDEAKELKASVNDYSYTNTIREIKESAVLYIDDFLKSPDGTKPTAADLKLSFEIINNRLYDKSKVTIISTEFPLDALIDFDEAIMGRLFQACGEYKITIPKDRAKNYRLRA